MSNWQHYHKQQLRQELHELQQAQEAHHLDWQQRHSGVEKHPQIEQHFHMQQAPQGQQHRWFAAESSAVPGVDETVSPSWVVGAPKVAMDMKKSTCYMHPQGELLQASYEGAIDMKAFGGADGIVHGHLQEAAQPTSYEHPCLSSASHAPPETPLPVRQLAPMAPMAPWPHETVAPNPAFWAERVGDDFGQQQHFQYFPERQQPVTLPQRMAASMPQRGHHAKVPAEAAAGLASRLGHAITRLEHEGDPTEVISDLRDIEASYNAALNGRLR